jgi:STAS domain
MDNNDDRPSLLAKMAKFVRHPTKDWSELDQPEPQPEIGYDKQALKAMIERKRQNDFVRKREFEQLRKLRNKDPVAIASLARASFFQSSSSAEQDVKANTLKKIDDIEAQMSKQWWKGKEDAANTQPAALGAQAKPPSDAQTAVPSALKSQNMADFSRTFQATEIASISYDPGQDAITTQMSSGGRATEGRQSTKPLGLDDAKRSVKGEQGFASSALFAMSSEDVASDPELDEAAIRFANGDDVGAEAGLLQALRAPNVTVQSGRPWAAALLDLYRATNRRALFDQAVKEFKAFFAPKNPVWIALSEAQPTIDYSEARPFMQIVAPDVPLWVCPEVLSQYEMESLRDVLSRNPMPWHLRWVKLRVISAEAAPLLDALFQSLAEDPVVIRFSGAATLLQRLREQTPANDRNVSTVWWQIRLNALRVVNLRDQFEMAALHCASTYGGARIKWQDPYCIFEASDFADLKPNLDSQDSDVSTTQAMGIVAQGALPLELRGEIVGDASQVLMQLDARTVGLGPIVVSCAALLRVDFAAAGNILNWVAVRQTQGHQVQFRDAHRLVAAFFNVIGINEHARVLARPI